MITEDFIRNGVLGFVWLQFIWELYLSLRQLRTNRNAETVPEELKEIMDQNTYSKARVYDFELNIYATVKDFYTLLMTTFLISNGLLMFWLKAGELLKYFGFEEDEILCSIIFLFMLDTFNTIIFLPFSIYYTFVLEEKHGFNNQTAASYIEDQLGEYIVQAIFSPFITAAIVWIAKEGGDFFFIYLWMFVLIITIFLFTYDASVYTSLPDGELKTRIEELAASTNYPLDKIYVYQDPKQPLYSEAYYYGVFMNKSIVLCGPLLEKCDIEEVLAVVGHELGHWKSNHIFKAVFLVMVNLLLLYLILGYLFRNKELYRAFGFYHEQPVIIGLIIIMVYLLSPYIVMLRIAIKFIQRKFEYEADAFAKSLGKGIYLRRALIKIYESNIKFPVYDWLFSMWYHTHPPLLDRMEALSKSE